MNDNLSSMITPKNLVKENFSRVMPLRSKGVIIRNISIFWIGTCFIVRKVVENWENISHILGKHKPHSERTFPSACRHLY